MEDWSDKAVMQAANCYAAMSGEEYDARLENLIEHGEREYADYVSRLTIPPYVLLALDTGDLEVLEDFQLRRGADYDFTQWLSLQKTLQRSGLKFNP